MQKINAAVMNRRSRTLISLTINSGLALIFSIGLALSLTIAVTDTSPGTLVEQAIYLTLLMAGILRHTKLSINTLVVLVDGKKEST